MKNHRFRQYLLLLPVMLLGYQVNAQQVKYRYDASGNRKNKELISVSNLTSRNSLKSARKDIPESEWDISEAVFGESSVVPSEEALKERKVTIYPNPTKGKLRVDITGGTIPEKSLFILHAATGNILKQQTGITATNLMDISSFPAGIYILRIILGEEVSVWKIVKE
ncbi:MAG: T9SS type A sorting domain-containing protein [Bacteroidales bacterium]|jgi:hypothetical protein|nr:T9SS type A sorting domain-containing protein [Bacteroidales bacterium]